MIEIIPFEPRFTTSMLEIAREIHSTSIYWDVPLDEEKLVRQLAASETLDPTRWFRLAVDGDVVLGAFYGCVMRTFFSDAPVAKDMGQWTRRDGGARNAWALLLSAFEAWARGQGARLASIGYHGLEDIEQKRRVFEMLGYRMTGYNTVKEL